jgi:23S rRNA pseudouridine955/2504/2580 synthase
MSVQTRAVTDDEADIRLDRWFRRHFPTLTQGVLQKLCRTGQVRVDGARCETSTRLSPGQTLRIPPLPKIDVDVKPGKPKMTAAQEAAIQAMVIHRDNDIIVLNKPYGIAVQGGPGIREHIDGWLDGLKFESEHRPRLVHRIDRDTSGILLLARSPGIAGKLASLFRNHDLEKIYWAIVMGRPNPPAGRIDMPLARVTGGRGERTAPAEDIEHGTKAISTYETLDGAGKKLAFMKLSPLTGRTHQLRVHMAAIGHPILGDPKYGTELSKPEGDLKEAAEKLHLHARSLTLPHPSGGMLKIEAELPPHMQETFRMLGFDDK